MTAAVDRIRAIRSEFWFVLVIVLSGLVYVGNTWSPSCYAVALRMFGATDDGLIWGKPRPIRSDEWAILTPLTQATVNNQFARFNKTSLYQEDLRINFSLPIMDWGIFFKPTYWAYILIDPAYAYSLHYFALMVLFLVGYAQFFRLLRAPPLIALLLAAGLYYTGFVQFWWNEKAANIALAPWAFIFAATPWRATIRYPLAAWAFASWLMSSFYPPLQIPLTLFFGSMLLAAQPAHRHPWRLAGLALAIGVGSGLAALYLQDYISLTSNTIYPGLRRVGGGGVPWYEWWSQWFPGITFDLDYESLAGRNICEISTVGLAFTLACGCFLDWRSLPQAWRDPEEKWLLWALCGLTSLMMAWMMLPLPSWSGMPLLWDRVQPDRMKFAAGLSLVILAYTISRLCGWRMTWPRWWLLVGLLVGNWLVLKGTRPVAPLEMMRDLAFLPGAFLAFFLARRLPTQAIPLFLAASLLQGILLFAAFNPIQSAYPIFHRPQTPLTAHFDHLHQQHGFLAVPGFNGSTLNGWGYRSVSHTLAVPKLDFWRARYPNLPDAEFAEIFNRYASIILIDEALPRKLHNDAVGVPQATFTPSAKTSPKTELDLKRTYQAGQLEHLSLQGTTLLLKGWAPFQASLAQRGLVVESTPAVKNIQQLRWIPRGDLGKISKSPIHSEAGFELQLELADTAKTAADLTICVIAEDLAAQKYYVLLNPPGLATCPALRPLVTQSKSQ